MEYENKYASNGKGNLGVTLGALGLGGALLNGGFGGILGGCGNNCGCSENHYVNRYELEMENKLVAKDSEIALLKSNIYTDEKITAAYRELNSEIGCIKNQLSQQAVVNAQITANISCMQGAISTFQGLVKTVVPIESMCPSPMPQYNSWTAPTAASGA